MPDERDWILVVEDEPDIREIVCMVLEEYGHRTVGAAEGSEALEQLRGRGPPALIILDLMMPGMDGWQLREEQLRDPRLAAIPVLILSGDGRVEEKAEALGAAGYLRKPVDLNELLATVDRHLARGSNAPTAPR